MGPEETEVVTDFSARLIEKLAKDNKNKPGEGLDSAASDGPAVPVDPLSLSSLLSQGFEEGPARQALRKFKNDTQAALDFLIGGGHPEEEQGGLHLLGIAEQEETVRMPTTVRRVQRLKERRRAQQARRREEEERRQRERQAEHGYSPSASPSKEKLGDRCRRQCRRLWAQQSGSVDLLDFEEKAAKSPGGPSSSGDLLDLMSSPGPGGALPSTGAAPVKKDDLLDLGFGEPPPPTDFTKESAFFRMLPEQLQDWYFQEKRDLKQQMHKTKVTYYKSPHHLVHTDANQLSKAEPKSVNRQDGADGIPPEDAAGSGAPEEPEGETLKLPDVLQLREQLTARAVQQGHLPSKMATSGLGWCSKSSDRQREEHRARLADLSKQAEQMKAVLHGQAPGAEGGEAASELVDPGLAKQVSRLRQLKDQQSQVAADLQQMRPGAKGEHVKGDKGDLKGHGKGGFKGDPGWRCGQQLDHIDSFGLAKEWGEQGLVAGKGPPDFKGKGYGGGKGKAFGKWPGKGDFFGGQIPEMLPEEAQAQAATAAEAFQQQQQWYPDWYASPPPMQAYRSPPMNRRSMQRPMQPPGMPRGDYRRSRGHALYGTSNPTLELARGEPQPLPSPPSSAAVKGAPQSTQHEGPSSEQPYTSRAAAWGAAAGEEAPAEAPPGAGGEGPEDGPMPADSTELPEDGTDPTTTMADKGTEESWRTGTAPVRGAGTGTTAAHPDEPPTDTVADRTSGASAAPALAEGGVAPEDVRSDGDSLHTAGAAQRHVVERGNGKHELDWVTDWFRKYSYLLKEKVEDLDPTDIDGCRERSGPCAATSSAVKRADRQLNKDKIAFMEQLTREVEEYQVDFQKYQAELEWVKSLESYAVKSFSDREKLFQIDQKDYSELEVVQDEYKPYFDLWSMAIDYNGCEEEWLTGKLANLSAVEVEQAVDDNYKERPAPAVTGLCSADIGGPAISTSAQKQHGLKVALQTMKNEWKAMAFGTLPYKNTGTFLLKGADDVQALLDDHIIKTQAVRGSPFVKPIEKEIQKCLNDYLETKRLAFPRFFFLSNDELLMILSQTKDPTAVQPHMGKCFEGINKVRFDQNDEIIEAMLSVEGEVVELVHQVNVNEGDKKGNVERWLLEVQDSMIKTLTKIMGDSVRAYAETSRGQWVLEWPGQVVIAVDNIYWTQEVAEAIEKGKLEDYYQVCASQLHDLVELVRGELSKLARRTLTAPWA
eukprot:g1018.t1